MTTMDDASHTTAPEAAINPLVSASAIPADELARLTDDIVSSHQSAGFRLGHSRRRAGAADRRHRLGAEDGL
ncbi:hypothetical protein X757_14980 [Mesorhizobium sp. LSHC414A00]|nr:hypothetical protein X757_14980 [Mesorhizobium sp. LSHC414A00]